MNGYFPVSPGKLSVINQNVNKASPTAEGFDTDLSKCSSIISLTFQLVRRLLLILTLYRCDMRISSSYCCIPFQDIHTAVLCSFIAIRKSCYLF